VAQAYGALKANGTSIQRTVFIVDKGGTVRYAKQGMPPDQELLEAIAGF
jgi:peroxiredoxin